MIWSAGPAALATTARWFGVLLAIKLALVLALFPYYQKTYRGENFAVVAKEILERTREYPLYTSNVSASGLSVAAHLDIMRLPTPPLTLPPAQWDSGFVITYEPDSKLGEIAARYQLGGKDLYLLCRGSACNPGKQ